MNHFITRGALLATTAIATLAIAHGAQAQTTTVYGGGASLPSIDYAGPRVVTNPVASAKSEFSSEQALDTHFRYRYCYASSGRGQTAFANNTASSYAPAPAACTSDPVVHYAASDAFITNPGPFFPYPRLNQDGPFIQIPMLGVGIALAAKDVNGGTNAFTNDGQLRLTTDAVCGIFSGKLATWAAVAALPGVTATGTSGALNVYYRSDSSGTSFLFTNFLKQACTTGGSGNSNFTASGLALAPISTFTSLFSGSPVPSNFFGFSGNAAVAGGLIADTSGMAYLSPDFTHITSVGRTNPGGLQTSTLFDASVKNGTSYVTPTPTNISTGLTNPVAALADNPTPPANAAAAADQTRWVPSIPRTTKGYPIVGYTNWLLSSCYQNANVTAAIKAFLTGHFGGSFNSVISSNGFVATPGSFNSAIRATFLTNSNGFDLDIRSASDARCGGLGR